MSTMTKEEAAKAISEKTEAAMKLIREAEAIANEHSLDFYFDVAYGMGGYYHGRPSLNDWNESNYEAGWSPSSQSC